MIVWLLGCSAAAPAEPQAVAEIADGALDELSGLVAATRFDGFWAVEDSGNPAQLVALDAKGARVGAVDVGAPNRDWEDLARAGDDLFIADIGDNLGVRAQIVVYRVPEPALTDRVAVAEAITLTWPEGPRDAEALVVTGPSLYIFSKSSRGDTRIGRAPTTPGTHVLVDVGGLKLGEGALAGDPRLTGAAYDGAILALRSYDHAWTWTVTDGDVPAALLAPPTDLPVAAERLGESIALTAGTYWTVSEGRHPSLFRGRLR